MNLKDTLTVAIGGLGLIWYYVCLFRVGTHPPDPTKPTAAFDQFMSLSLTTISVSLATFVGMLLGIQGVANNVAQVQQAAATAPALEMHAIQRIAASIPLTTALQWAAATLYILSLVVALAFWWWKGEKSDPAVTNLGKSLLGLIGGALSVLLNV